MALKFGFRVARGAVMGNDLHVQVGSTAERRIVRLQTVLDGFELGDDAFPPSTHVERDFRAVGQWSPGQEHVLVVVATDEEGSEETATKIFVDASTVP